MKKIVSLLLALIMISSFCAFSQQAEAAAAEEPAPEADALVVDTCILLEADDAMINNYSLLAVNPEAPWVDADGNAVSDVTINTVGAAALINWLLSEEGQELAANYGFEEYGEYLFYLKDGRPEVYSAGTGKSIANAKMGNADLILVHSKKQEEAFIEEGFSYVLDGMDAERLNWMYNYFVLCGPSADPAGVKDAADVKAAFQAIADGKFTFISRGDGSGTHTKEISLWPEDLGITAEAESFKDYTDWYISANTGMGACLVMAEEMGAYILTDKATFLTFVANDGVMG